MASAIRTENFTLQSDPKLLQPLLRDKITPFLEQSGFDAKITGSLLVAVGEAVTNCIRHSYHNESGHPIEITAENYEDRVVFRIRDYGEKVDMQRIHEKEKPKLPPETGGGLGVYFIKTILDHVEYNTAHAKGNELVLVKMKSGAKS